MGQKIYVKPKSKKVAFINDFSLFYSPNKLLKNFKLVPQYQNANFQLTKNHLKKRLLKCSL